MAKAPNTTTAPTGQLPPFGLRMLPELKERIETAARESGRSMNAEIVARLQESLNPGELESSDMARTVQRLQTELDDRSADMQKLRELLRLTKNMFGLLQGKMRESRAQLSPDEAHELGELLKWIHIELEKPEPIELMLERIDELANELDEIHGALRNYGVNVDSERLADATATRERIAAMRSKWTAVKKKSDE
ncbi:Arc family DNA-binding protein [Variovorax sp. 38R]|uniref:Arc family DNA-binding protein n=1 Tax=Variovorax sp. 38R TaxID=2774875 RepID=UPI00177F5482|nr:Arc family DNA-binding protein [Variovorax sp. 38R]QOF76081.1 Arc family DNA-binding protein [Variovorax sp. 38R]